MKQASAWVLYDDQCGFCTRWMSFWKGVLARRGIGIAPLQADWVRHRLDVAPEDLLNDLRMLTADGRIVEGADVYRYVMRRIGWAYPAYVLTLLPGLRHVFDRAYRTFATHRYRVSRMCRLEGLR